MDHSAAHAGTLRVNARLVERAVTLCRSDPREPTRPCRLLHVAGILAANDGQLRLAAVLLKRSVALDATNADSFGTLGDILSQLHLHDEAIAAHLRARQLTGDVRILRGLAIALHRAHRHFEASAVYAEALAQAPDDPSLYEEIGNILQIAGRWRLALKYFQYWVELRPRSADALLRLGHAQLACGLNQLALASFQEGLLLAPERPDIQVGLGEALMRLGAVSDAAKALRRALSADPRDVRASRLFVGAMERLGNTADAAGAWLHFGSMLHSGRRYRDAVVAYQQTIARKPDCLSALAGLGHCHLALGQPAIAAGYLRMALKIAPNDSRLHLDLGQALHLTGNADEGWNEFAWHYHPGALSVRRFEQPLWDGTSLNGRTILLWTEQGRGDTIQFLRYISFVKDRGGRIVIDCHHRGLIPLIAQMDWVDEVVANGSPRPAFDTHAPLVYLPAIYPDSRRLPTRIPYLTVHPAARQAWRERVNPGRDLLVGLSWAANAHHRSGSSRSVPLETFEALSELSGMRLISLQFGIPSAELYTRPSGLVVEQLFGQSFPIDEAAALISNLDLVITVDTMIAHLSGALGVPVWTLLRFGTNWRWLIHGEKSEWYPTMTLFRQSTSGDWVSVIKNIKMALIERLTAFREAGRERESLARTH